MSLRLLTLSVVLAAAVSGCDNVSLEPRFQGVPRFGAEPKSDPWNLVGEGEKAAGAELEALRRSAEGQLQALEVELRKLQDQAHRNTDEARAEADATWRRLDARRRELEEQLRSSGKAGEDLLKNLGRSIDEAVREAKAATR